MRLLAIVLLFSYCFLASANQTSTDEADCDDQNVFRAADEVLKSFNDAKQDGNQFVLFRITEARKKEETGKLHIFINFKIQESVCPVKNGIYWQRCAFKVNDADYGQCSAHVLLNPESKSWDIVKENCSTTKRESPPAPIQPVVEPIVTAVQYRSLGNYHVIDTNSEMLSPIIQSAIEKMNREGNHQYHFGLENITKAEQQVVSGWNYKLQYNIRQTNCSKSLFPKWTGEECSLDQNGQSGNCLTNVFVTPNEEIKDMQLTCQSSTGFCLSCPDHVEKNDPELVKFLKQFIEEYNSQSNHSNVYKFQNVQTATRKLFPNGKQYKVEFEIQETDCAKVDDNIEKKCEIKEQGNHLVCLANFNVANETVNILQDYNCNSPQRMRLAIKGLSPLRSIVTLQRRVSRSPEKSKRKGHEQDHKEQKHGKKEKKDKKEHKKHNGKHDHHDHSSEESAEDNRYKPQVLPRPTEQTIPQVPEIATNVLVTTPQKANPTSAAKDHGPPLTLPPTSFIPNISHSLPLTPAVPEQGTYPNIHETVILDLPSLDPEDVPKCPGKLWQPLSSILQITTDKPFVIEGLSFHDDDLLLESEKQLPSLDIGGLLTDDDLDF